MGLRRTFSVVALVAIAAVQGGPTAARPASGAEGAPSGSGEGLKLVAHIDFPHGSHQELATIKGRDYAFVSELNEPTGTLRVIDVTVPEKAHQVAAIPCSGYQGNIQISHDRRTLVLGMDAASTTECLPAGQMGFVTIDISDPLHPKSIGYAINEKGSHSLAAHPTKPFVYNAEGFPDAPGRMQVWSIKNPAKPKLVTTLDTGVHSPHDLAFNRTGTMAATANIVNFHLLDTRDPANPKIVHTNQCPGCMHTHEARFTPDGKRLIVNDEYVYSATCPGGLMYFYDLAGDASAPNSTLTGTYFPTEIVPSAATAFCAAHIFDISADGTRIAASWHDAGIRYLDITATAGVTHGTTQVVPGGPTELGWYRNTGGDAFSAKLFKGPYVYAVDLVHGFQVFKATAP